MRSPIWRSTGWAASGTTDRSSCGCRTSNRITRTTSSERSAPRGGPSDSPASTDRATFRGGGVDWRWNYASYLAACASIDANLGRLVDALRADGRLDDTIIVFASDHGSHFRTRNLEYKRSPHDASIRGPPVIAGPGFTGGRRRRDLVTQLDLLPTLVAAAGGDAADVDGTPLQGDTGRGDVFVPISESQIGRAIRTPTHTLAVAARSPNPLAGHLRPAADSYRLTHLYDNVADPHQHRNLVRDQASRPVVDELMDLLAQRIAEVEGATPRLVPR